MIFYFSGTGNSKWAAEQIAARIGDCACDIMTQKEPPALEKEPQVGLVFPVYAWGAPEPMVRFASTLGKTDAFSFGVCTCGSEAGYAMKKLSALFPLHSSYSLVMPNNYIIGAEVDDEQTVRQKLRDARREIEVLSREILARNLVYRVQEGAMAGLKSSLVNWGFHRFARSTKSFRTTDQCNGCGRCAQECPAGTISMEEERPVWGKACFQCLRCINACPQRAIEYGNATAARGRYTIQRYIEAEDALAE